MLTAVEAVTSMSQWQLALFNAWSHGGEGGGIHRLTSYVTCHMYICHIHAAALRVTGRLLNLIIPRAYLWGCLCLRQSFVVLSQPDKRRGILQREKKNNTPESETSGRKAERGKKREGLERNRADPRSA